VRGKTIEKTEEGNGIDKLLNEAKIKVLALEHISRILKKKKMLSRSNGTFSENKDVEV